MSIDLDTAKYVAFTTYKKDNTPVSTPVWIVPFEGGYAFTTDPGSYKMRRIKNDARATLQVCNMKGKPADGAPVYSGAAVALDEAASLRVAALVKKKYKIGWAMLGVLSAWKKLTAKGTTATAEAAIKVVINR